MEIYADVKKNEIMAFARKLLELDIHQVTWNGPNLKRQISQVENSGEQRTGNFNSKFQDRIKGMGKERQAEGLIKYNTVNRVNII